MKQPLIKFFLRDPSKWQFWVLFAFACKGLTFIFLLSRYEPILCPGFWGMFGGDTSSYLTPIDNLLAYGNYTPDFRMPGYGILYMPLALISKKTIAYNILIICQFIVASLAVYPLALIAKNIFKSNSMFYLTFYLFAISIYSNMFDATLQTESFAVSFLILSVFFFLKAIQNESKRNFNLFLSGLLLTEVAFLRNIFLVIPLLFCIVLIVSSFKERLQKKLPLKLLIFLFPFLIFEGAWITRNYIKHHKILPATTTYGYPSMINSYYLQLYTLVRSWGGSDQIGEPHADATWFFLNDGLPLLASTNVSLPGYIYTSKFNYDSLVILRKQLSVYVAAETKNDSIALNSSEMKAQLATIRAKCLLYAASIKEEKPFLYYVIAPLRRTKIFLIHSGTYNLFHGSPDQLPILSYCVKVFYSLFYLLIMGLGAIGMLLLFSQSIQFKPIALLTGIVFYTVIIHPVIFGTCEMRYFLPAYPFMLISAAYAIIWTVKKYRTNNLNKAL